MTSPERARNLDSLEAAFELLPSPALLVAPGSARILFANRAAHRLAGGQLPPEGPADPRSGQRRPTERAASGESFANVPVDWPTPDGLRSLIVTGATIAAPDGDPVAVVTFDDVTDLRATERSELRVRRELQAILDNVADAITAQDTSGRLIYVNLAAVRLLGYDDAEALRTAPLTEVRERFDFRGEDGEPLPLESLPGRRALLGEEPEPMVLRFRPADGGSERWSRIKARPLFDERGRVRMAINLIEDVTELKQAEHQQRFLAEAGRVLASSLDYERTLSTVASLAVPGISDWCVVDLATPEGFERVAIANADPDKLRWTEEVSRRYPPDPGSPTGVPQVLRTGEPEHYPELPEELLIAAARDEEHLRLIREVGMVSAMIVPMSSRGETVGAITMVSTQPGRHFDADDLVLAQELGRRAGNAVENARLHRQRSEIARTLQASLLPPALPDIAGMETAAVFRPAGEGLDVGGDFYDLFSTASGEWVAVIGDVCGKGSEAAALTAMVRHTVRAAAVHLQSPAAMLRWLNDAMLRQGGDSLRFCTLAVVRLESGPAGVRVLAASGGHPLPRLLRADGRVERLGTHGTLVGVKEDIDVADHAARLAPGDALVLFTDGLVEAGAPEVVWSMEDVDAAVAAAADGAQAPLEDLVERLSRAATGGLGRPLRDDLAVLALRVRG